MKVVSLLLLVALAGCAKADAIVGPAGAKAHVISCMNPLAPELSALEACYKQAGEICGSRGYVMLDREAHQGWHANRYGGGSVSKHSIVIQCRGAP